MHSAVLVAAYCMHMQQISHVVGHCTKQFAKDLSSASLPATFANFILFHVQSR